MADTKGKVETIDTIPPKVTERQVKNDNPLLSDATVITQGTTQAHKLIYLEADGVFKPIPEVIVQMITDMTKDKFSKILVASGQITDSELSSLRLSWLLDMVTSAHKAWEKTNADSAERKAKKFYQDLRKRGFSKEDASKMAKYNPLD